jgi:hypothetical protein
LVALSYGISAASDVISHLVTRLIVDGSEDLHFRSISGNTLFHGISASGFVYLSAGKHVIKVEYRTPTNSTNVAGGDPKDWQTASLQINY